MKLGDKGDSNPPHIIMQIVGLFGTIIDNRLRSVFKEWDPLVLGEVELVMGKEFMISKERYQTNVDIAFRFVATLLDLELPKAKVLLITRKLVMADLLGGVEEVIIVVELGVGIPCSRDMRRLLLPNIQVKRYPFLLDVKGVELCKHRTLARKGVDFLKIFLYLEVAPKDSWKGRFKEYL